MSLAPVRQTIARFSKIKPLRIALLLVVAAAILFLEDDSTIAWTSNWLRSHGVNPLYLFGGLLAVAAIANRNKLQDWQNLLTVERFEAILFFGMIILVGLIFLLRQIT